MVLRLSCARWRPYKLDEILQRDKVSLDLFWLRDENLEDSAGLPNPHLLAAEIAEDLRSSLEQIEEILGDLRARVKGSGGAGAQRPSAQAGQPVE